MLEDSLNFLRKELITDGGPWYHEFEPSSFVLEPWNAYTSLLFFVPVLFWIWKLKGEYKQQPIIVALLPFLFLNGLGSTLFHAFRTDRFLFYLDVLPASALSIILSTYLWSLFFKKWYYGFLIVVLFYVLGYLSISYFVHFERWEDMAPNIGYFFVGISFFGPVFLLLGRTRFYKARYAIATFVFLTLALIARASDYPSPKPFPEQLPQGTHFLWHIFTVLAVFSMGYYIYYLKRIEHIIRPK
ncbi:MAG: hypothetical protein WDZ35_04640 [Crocinitomicaceae bacterium]